MKLKEAYDYELLISELNRALEKEAPYRINLYMPLPRLFNIFLKDKLIYISTSHRNAKYAPILSGTLLYDMCLNEGITKCARWIITQIELSGTEL